MRSAEHILMRQYKMLEKNPNPLFTCRPDANNIFRWECIIIGPQDTPYEGGIFPAVLTFPKNFPMNPPKMAFSVKMFHPNIDENNGEVCISTLHAPGVDAFNEQELACERWLPVHTIESIILSVISMLTSPNPTSPANVNAAKLYTTDMKKYWDTVREYTNRTMDMPDGHPN